MTYLTIITHIIRFSTKLNVSGVSIYKHSTKVFFIFVTFFQNPFTDDLLGSRLKQIDIDLF